MATSLSLGDSGDKSDAESKPRSRAFTTFCETTTFHGLRNVAETIWMSIVVITTLVFMYQCQDLVRLYLRRPVRMTMTMSRQAPVVFPAVTICNQNAFRLVAAAENGSYGWLDDMYSRTDKSTFNYTKWNVSNVSMRDVYLQFAHLQEDMIAS
ncbi:hypothetical protein NP493_1354g00019 [Ridgeia piscesae]|uniref:Uncharacterized protein n=1 Tax=Ridgeia piscesae TaxID=27915 RepID=A0AAD9K6L1_RIDPI|nr:hypothetical protein NP493_1354g00019 [Ridgeia piscesae]